MHLSNTLPLCCSVCLFSVTATAGQWEINNDLKYTDYAEWAQKQYHLKTARGYVRELENPSTTPERHDEILHELKHKGDTEAATYAIRESTHEETKHQIKAGDDINDDAKLQNVNDAALNDFLNLKT